MKNTGYDDPHLLTVQGLTKRYGDLSAVSEVSLDIVPGEIFALLGPNGAGKTTLIGCITGLIMRYEGSVQVAGYDVREHYRITRQLVGLVPQELNFDGFFNTFDVVKYQGGYFGVRPDVERIRRLLDDFSLSDKAAVNTRKLSGGMKRRLMICKALMHDPVILFLDEPTAGVDVELREELWDYVRRLRDRGMTIFLTTHYIEEAERLADRIGIINRGRLLRVQSREDLFYEFGRRWIEVRLSGEPGAGLFAGLAGLSPTQPGPRRLRIAYQDRMEAGAKPAAVEKLLEEVRRAGLSVEGVEAGRSSLESIFRQILRADAPG